MEAPSQSLNGSMLDTGCLWQGPLAVAGPLFTKHQEGAQSWLLRSGGFQGGGVGRGHWRSWRWKIISAVEFEVTLEQQPLLGT